MKNKRVFKLIKSYPSFNDVGMLSTIGEGGKITYNYTDGSIMNTVSNLDTTESLIEAYLNFPEFWEEVIISNYKIIKETDVGLTGYTVIDIVMRLSDRVIFNVGDLTNKGVIESFYEHEETDDLYINTEEKEGAFTIEELVLLANPIKECHDGWVYDGDDIYVVKLESRKVIKTVAPNYCKSKKHGYAIFKNEDGAHSYLSNNLRVLSLNDIIPIISKIEIVLSMGENVEFEKVLQTLENIVNSRLKKK